MCHHHGVILGFSHIPTGFRWSGSILDDYIACYIWSSILPLHEGTFFQGLHEWLERPSVGSLAQNLAFGFLRVSVGCFLFVAMAKGFGRLLAITCLSFLCFEESACFFQNFAKIFRRGTKKQKTCTAIVPSATTETPPLSPAIVPTEMVLHHKYCWEYLEPGTKVILLGNPGSGKSTLLNSFSGSCKFKSGISFGGGKTRQWKAVTLPNNVTFIDTPGLADYEIRSEVAKNITEALQEGGNFKFLFVATTLNGRFKAEDVTTIKLVLDAVPQIDVDEYGIIVNQLEAAEFEGLKKPENQKKFFMPLWAGLQKITSHIELLEKDPELSGCENSVKEFPNMQQFVSSLPTVRIDPSAVKDVESREFSQIREEYENLVNDEEKMLEELRKKEEQIRRLETVPTWLKGILTVLSTMALVGAMVVL